MKNDYNLEERLAKFGESIIDLVKEIKITATNRRIIDQLVGASGSAGANYCEANYSEGKKDFTHKIGIVCKELNESKHWLRMLARSNPEKKELIRVCWQENQELILIFSKIYKTSQKNIKNSKLEI